METIVITPRNKTELELVATLMKRMNIRATIQKKEAMKKKKAKEEFLNSFENRLKEVQLHSEGKIKLKSWDELYTEL